MDFNQLMGGSTPLNNLALAPATFDDLAAAILGGRTDNSQLAGLVSAAPLVSSPETSYLYGVRHLSLSMGVSFTYDRSSRSRFHTGFYGVRSQPLGNTGREVVPGMPLEVQLRRTTSAGASAGWSYDITPRDTLSVDVSGTRVASEFQDAYVSHSAISFGRKLSERWFVRGMVGAGVFTPVRETLVQGRFTRHEWGGSIGYKVYAHTFLGSYTNMVSDIFGLGANSNISSAGAWSWKRPGRSISLSSTFGYSQLVGPSFPNSGSWSFHTTVARALNAHMVLTGSYRYIQYPRLIYFYSPTSSVNGLITSLGWSPAARE